MAGRYTAADKKKALRAVKKAVAEGKSLNAACVQVVERQGWPSVGALTKWVKESEAVADSDTSEVEVPQIRGAARNGRKRRSAQTAPQPPAAAPEETAEPDAGVTEEVVVLDGDHDGVDAGQADAGQSVALVQVTSGVVTGQSDPQQVVTELVSEIRRLQVALDNAHSEIDMLRRTDRPMRELLAVYLQSDL